MFQALFLLTCTSPRFPILQSAVEPEEAPAPEDEEPAPMLAGSVGSPSVVQPPVSLPIGQAPSTQAPEFLRGDPALPAVPTLHQHLGPTPAAVDPPIDPILLDPAVNPAPQPNTGASVLGSPSPSFPFRGPQVYPSDSRPVYGYVQGAARGNEQISTSPCLLLA